MIPIENRKKYGHIKVVNFMIILLKKILKINNIKMYSTCNEGKSVVAERFIRIIKNKIHKYVTAISKMFIIMCWTILLINIITLFTEQ